MLDSCCCWLFGFLSYFISLSIWLGLFVLATIWPQQNKINAKTFSFRLDHYYPCVSSSSVFRLQQKQTTKMKEKDEKKQHKQPNLISKTRLAKQFETSSPLILALPTSLPPSHSFSLFAFHRIIREDVKLSQSQLDTRIKVFGFGFLVFVQFCSYSVCCQFMFSARKNRSLCMFIARAVACELANSDITLSRKQTQNKNHWK